MKLEEYLRRANKTPNELAAALGVARWTVDRYIHGRVPSPAIMMTIYEETRGKVAPNDFYDLPDLR